MSTFEIKPQSGWSLAKYDVLQDGGLRYVTTCPGMCGKRVNLLDVCCSNRLVLTTKRASLSSKVQIQDSANNLVTTAKVSGGYACTGLSFNYGGRSYRWHQSDRTLKYKFALVDSTAGVEVATLSTASAWRRQSELEVLEGYYDPAWVQLVVMTGVIVFKAAQEHTASVA